MCGEFRDIMTRSPTIPSRSSWVQTALQCLTRDVATVLVSLLSRSWGLLCPHLTSLLNMTSDFQNEKRKWSSLLRMIALWSLLSMLFMQAARAGGKATVLWSSKKKPSSDVEFWYSSWSHSHLTYDATFTADFFIFHNSNVSETAGSLWG